MASKVIYLTGAPASGKSSISGALKLRVQKLAVFEYGSRLTSFVSSKNSQSIDQSTIRERSSAVVTPEYVAAVDEELLQFVRDERAARHVVIDSHAVTKESYGFRVTPYSLQKFAELSPSHIWVEAIAGVGDGMIVIADDDELPWPKEVLANVQQFASRQGFYVSRMQRKLHG